MLIDSRSLWLAETNCFVVAADSGGPCVIVDAPPDPSGIAALLAKHDLYAEVLLLTHGHIDHSGGAGPLTAAGPVALYVHPDDDYLSMNPVQQMRAAFGFVDQDYEPLVDRLPLAGGQVIAAAGIELSVLHTPGHTPGHCCFLSHDEGVLWSGDQLFAGSIGRTDLPGGNTVHLANSMREKVMTLDDDVRVLTGHGPETTIGRERHTNPFRDLWA